MTRHQFIIDPSDGAVDMLAHVSDGHQGPVCYRCGKHICVKACTKRRGRLVPIDSSVCTQAHARIFVVYDPNAVSYSHHLTKTGALSEVDRLVKRDRKAGIAHDGIKEPYPIEEEELWL